jgi:hypothetical protein
MKTLTTPAMKLNVGLTHSLDESDPSPGVTLPEVQAWQVTVPEFDENVFDGQSLQDVDFALEKVPGTHSSQLPLVALAKDPAGQS